MPSKSTFGTLLAIAIMLMYTLAFSALVAGALGDVSFLDGRIIGGKPTTIYKTPSPGGVLRDTVRLFAYHSGTAVFSSFTFFVCIFSSSYSWGLVFSSVEVVTSSVEFRRRGVEIQRDGDVGKGWNFVSVSFGTCYEYFYKFNKFPRLVQKVSLETYSISGKYRHICGGSIIGNNWVLTAAHCVGRNTSPGNYKIRAGSSYKGRNGDQYELSEIIKHPKYNGGTKQNDIALIKVVQPFKFGQNVNAIQMATQTPAVHSQVFTTGWGSTKEGGTAVNQLQEVGVYVVDRGVCHEANKHIAAVTENMMCAGVPGGGKDTCQGDSGGPLIYKRKLAGVVSWGDGCGRPGYPGVYADVAYFRDWVFSHTGL